MNKSDASVLTQNWWIILSAETEMEIERLRHGQRLNGAQERWNAFLMAISNFKPEKYARDLSIIFCEVHFNSKEERAMVTMLNIKCIQSIAERTTKIHRRTHSFIWLPCTFMTIFISVASFLFGRVWVCFFYSLFWIYFIIQTFVFNCIHSCAVELLS